MREVPAAAIIYPSGGRHASQETLTLSKRDVVQFLFKWKYSLIGYFLLVVAAVTALVYLLPQKYAATASVLVESNRAPAMRTDIAFGAEELSVLNSEVAIIWSHTVLAATADQVGFGESDPPNAVQEVLIAFVDWLEKVGLKEPMGPREALIRQLEKHLEVEPLAASNVIKISMSGKSPERTAAIVNAVTDSYIRHHLKVYSSKGTSEVYQRQLQRLGEELDRRRKRLQDYKRRAALSAVDETMRAMVQRQTTLATQLSEANQSLTELQTRFGPGHTRISLARDRVESIQISLQDTRQRLQALEAQDADIRDMELQISAIEASYKQYQARYEEERLNDLANPDVVNVRVIEYATEPTRPSHSRIFYIALAAAGGALLALMIALVREYFDHRVTDPGHVARLLGVPTLGTVERFGPF